MSQLLYIEERDEETVSPGEKKKQEKTWTHFLWKLSCSPSHNATLTMVRFSCNTVSGNEDEVRDC